MKSAAHYRLRRRLGVVLSYVGVLVALAFFLMPFLWILSTSLKGNEDYFTFPPVWFPAEPSLKHYYGLFTQANGWLYLRNSLAISSLSMFAALFFSIPTAYSVARFRFGGSMFSNFLLLLRTMPAIALVIPIYVIYRQIGFTNNYFGLILLYTVFYIPFAVWLLIGFIRDVPLEIEEAALIDGCSYLQALLRVVLPVIVPGLAVVALFAFINTWNEFLFALLLTGADTKTLMVLVSSYTSGSPTDTFFGEASASTVLGIIPAFLVAFALQRYLVKGLSLGAVKG
jgi:multiple sugar transport system permease protein